MAVLLIGPLILLLGPAGWSEPVLIGVERSKNKWEYTRLLEVFFRMGTLLHLPHSKKLYKVGIRFKRWKIDFISSVGGTTKSHVKVCGYREC